MENLVYTKESIEMLLNIVNNMSFKGFHEAENIMRIYQILNNPVREGFKDENK